MFGRICVFCAIYGECKKGEEKNAWVKENKFQHQCALAIT
jgi:hypothetical protein